ncbi:MAG: TIGR03087 family PEP-CTERM/XrtA system glycosyltransferase [Sedimenticola selenatireducens]|uniref:TIGR03087 family PEP-CTERM/XrtA system glycosyltransferase n=2 Tax=Sedimenticola selenatireducens TaxID=191960 RepID=A0A558DRM8_9GAMM|nr:TIGR03087 family PEP-CTERM/XrtA system glycosyltransferase [Sedimenticola selenatireducens]TVT63558.1 MAG: TIGR03087 family PEP-CTERM/XrtA system glycosyltransferase [Sedimenticola selenatireducens]
MKPPLLYLCHRIPYPPNKGDKIRSYHLLRYLCEHYEVYLGAFIDDPNDWKYVSVVNEMCSESLFLALNPSRAKIRSLTALVNGEALTLPYYFNRKMAEWVNQIVTQKHIERVIVYSSAMAQYVEENNSTITKRVIDFVDIDSDKWRQYAEKKTWPMNWIYRREAKKLLSYEKFISTSFDASLFVSSAEADLFRSLIATSDEEITYYNNGVDTDYFSPSSDFVNPYPEDRDIVVFTGAMDYWPNIDAVIWFAQEVLPEIARHNPDLYFYIVGSNPSENVRKLADLPRIEVTGRVEDIRPYLQFAKVAVAPMRVARGIQNKVLEAMAMEKTVVVTPQGYEGINAVIGTEVIIAENAQEMINIIPKVVSGDYPRMGSIARSRVQSDFNWEANLPIVGHWLEADKGNYDR